MSMPPTVPSRGSLARPVLHARTLTTYWNDASILAFLERNLASLRGMVLDIGCGTMRYRDTILSATNVTAYLGLDLEPGKFAYSVVADLYWDGVHMPLEDASVDSALLFEVLEHCADPRIVLAEAVRVLKPGGVLLFSTPFVYPLHGVPFDFQRLTPFGAKVLLASAGFASVEIEAGGGWDASLGQTVSAWIAHRPMPRVVRGLLAVAFVPIFRVLLAMDRRHRPSALDRDGGMVSGILGRARKS